MTAKYSHLQSRSIRRAMSALAVALLTPPFQVTAGPEGMQAARGTATMTHNGSQTTITASHNAFLNWSSFNVGAGEGVRFQQPSSSSVVWNRINGGNPSQIYGSVEANGILVLANPSGFYFGPNSFVKAAGLFVTTAPIVPSNAIDAPREFPETPPSVPIVNYGHLETVAGGSLFLIAKQIENHGTLTAPEGSVGLVSGKEVLLCDRPDGRGLTARVKIPEGTIDNRGQIIADAGRILMNAQTVNQGGLVQANSVRERNGVIEIFASDKIELGTQSALRAQGSSDAPSAGGQITVKSAGSYRDSAGSIINAAGGANGGNGGAIELSAPIMAAINSEIGAAAQAGWTSGSLLLDPRNITIGNSGTGSAPGGVVNVNDSNLDLALNINSAFRNFANISLQASGNITVQANWSLPVSTGKDELNSKLTLQAGKDIILSAGGAIRGGDHWSISLEAGANFGSGAITPGTGNITLNGPSFIETAGGSITAKAGNNVTVGNGAIRTTQGGSIDVTAVSGSVNAGSGANGYIFSTSGYTVAPSLGGISTAAGGNVSIVAGRDVTGFVPPQSGAGVASEAGTGAFGEAPGNVTIKAGGDVSGHFVVRNGAGSIDAGGSAGTTSSRFALSLISGSWNVRASDSITLQEARNPNGVFNQANVIGGGDAPLRFLFDYNPAASLTLEAGDRVTLTGTSLPRNSQGAGIPIVYPPTLNVIAGAGGFVLGNDISLFPSTLGNLSIDIKDGGNFSSSSPTVPRRLVMSDSDARQWTNPIDFTSEDRGNNLLHQYDPTPASVKVSGSMSGVLLTSSKPLHMEVAGNINNSSVRAKNFHSDDETSIEVGGQIFYRPFFTFVQLTETDPEPDLTVFLQAEGGEQLSRKLVYDPKTRQLGFAGRMQAEERDALKNLRIPFFNGVEIIYLPLTFVAEAMIDALYDTSQDVPTSPVPGISVSGPGKLNITASSINLGVSDGIQSLGVVNSSQLAGTPRGADININLTGDFDMLSSTVISRYGGSINLFSAGKINVGSGNELSSSTLPRGIVTLGAGNIDVRAIGDVDVNGSRIASYDGGNIHVRSENGDVNAGSGGSGYIIVEKPYFDPELGQIAFLKATIPGSGILATSFPFDIPGQQPILGNIAVETPNGDIVAGAGGFVQVDLNGAANKNATIRLVAGSRNPDGSTAHVGNIAANNSGVIGAQVDLDATGDITGLVVSRGNLAINAQQNVSVTAIGQGAVNISSASGNVAGTIVGLGPVNVSGANISANVVANVGQASVSGNVSSTPSAQAPAPSTSSQVESKNVEKVAAANTAEESDDDEKKRKKPVLTKRRMSRVTVILPKS